LVYFSPFWYFVPRKIWQPCRSSRFTRRWTSKIIIVKGGLGGGEELGVAGPKKTIIHNSIAGFFLKYNTLAGFELGSSVPEADASLH
jgi:hypothetical protein